MYVDPTTVRLSDTFLLSDFMGCTSVYRYGYCNRFQSNDTLKLAEGKKLARTITEMETMFGPASVAYGFISPELSRKIVTYQNPDKPSYHRWDKGAAADLYFPGWVDIKDNSPIQLAFDIDSNIESYSRMITYAETPWICFATQLTEEGRGRRAFYENRYVGERKPKYVTYSQVPKTRRRQIDAHSLDWDWEGTGWPQYHMRGVRQLEHYYSSVHTTFLSFLYNRSNVHEGVKNLPPFTNRDRMERFRDCARMAGQVIDDLQESLGKRVSIVDGYNANDNRSRTWRDRFYMEIVPPVGVDYADMLHTLFNMELVDEVWPTSRGVCDKSLHGIRIRGVKA